MLFATHLIGGYVFAKLFNQPSIPVIAGAALPDLVDKPLGILGIAPYYHTVAHSILTVIVFSIIAIKFRRLVPVIIGWISHIFMDALHILINRGVEATTFIFYPVMFPDKPQITDGSVNFVVDFWSNYLWTIGFYTEFIFWGIGIYFIYREREELIQRFHHIVEH